VTEEARTREGQASPAARFCRLFTLSPCHLVTLSSAVIVRRFLLLAALLFWQGGFIFYTAVVVPIGTEELGGARQQGFITRRVTHDLNLAGAVALAVFALELPLADPSSLRRFARRVFWLGLVLAQAALFYQHAYLDSLLRPAEMTVIDPSAFRPAHRVYLWISTVQWGLAVAFALLTLTAWRAQDRQSARNE